MKIAAAYIRVSTDDQLEYSPDSQIKLIRDFAKKNNLILPDEFIFVDEGISGKTANKRPAFNKMIAIAKEKEKSFDVILVWKFSRFARNQEESIVFKKMLKKSNVDVVSISEPISDDHFGSLIERIIEWMDEYYVIRLSDEVKRGMTEKATRGEPLCHPAFGYDMINKEYYPNPEQAPVVKEIFERFTSGEKLSSITRWLQSINVRTSRGNSPDRRFVEYILHNPVYTGKIRWCTDGRAASRRDYYNENMLIVEGKHQAIVSQDLFDKAEKIFRDNKKRYRKYQRSEQNVDFMLKGLVRCSNCGATLVYTNATAHSLQCHNYSSQRGCNVSHNISLRKAEPIVIEALKTACKDLNFTIDIQDNSKTNSSNTLENLLKKEQLKLNKIKEAYLNGIDTIEEYKEQKAKITETISMIQNEIKKEAHQDAFSPKSYAKKVMNIVKLIESPDATPQAKNEALRSIISKIVYNKANKSLDLYFYT
jgi:DNA invertase Pin-like site-specific DNA recombinase